MSGDWSQENSFLYTKTRVLSPRCRVQNLEFRVQCLGSELLGLGFRGLGIGGFGICSFGIRVFGSVFGVWGLELKLID